jgi:hypothetical protein
MLVMKPVDHEPESFAIVLNVCRFCGRSAKPPYSGLKSLRVVDKALSYRSFFLPKPWGFQRRPTLAGIDRHHGVLVKRGAEISKLQKRRKYHDRYNRLREGRALCAGNHYKTGRAENNDRGQNDKPESNSEHRPDHCAANRQRNHATVLHKRIGNRNGRRLKMA